MARTIYAIKAKNNRAALDAHMTNFSDKKERPRAYAAGQILVNINNGILCSDTAGIEGPKVFVIVNPTSNEI
jgi:hypothetical protein